MGSFTWGAICATAILLLIGAAASSSAEDQCKRTNHVKDCVMVWIPANQPGGDVTK